MHFKKLFVVVALGLAFLIAASESTAGIFGFLQEPEVKRKKVKRVKRPVFTERDSSGIYFQSVFDEAIQGDRLWSGCCAMRLHRLRVGWSHLARG